MSYGAIENLSEVACPPAVAEQGGFYVQGGKRILDIVVVVLILPIVLPVISVAWLITWLQGGSGFFRQPRVGAGGRIFQCLKIRSMAVDAERILAEYLSSDPKIAAEWRVTQKLKTDPRITRFGQFLRSSSIDELPQVWNVLIGDMSLFGPRPFTPNQKNIYDAVASSGSYYRLRPGISGLWQVRSRNVGEFQDRVAYDEEYAAKMSMAFDLQIALWTVVVVLRATGK